MKYEISRNYAGAPEDTTVIAGESKTCFYANRASEDAAYWVSFSMEAPIDDTYIMLPACAYNGNRFETVRRPYPPMFTEEELGTDVPLRMTQVPALRAQGDSFMDVTTGDLAVPCVCILRKTLQQGFMLFFEQGCHGLNHGVTLEQTKDVLTVTLRAPAKRRLVYRWYDGIPSLRENPEADALLSVQAGEETVITHEIDTFACADIPELYRIFFEKRSRHYKTADYAQLPFSAFWDLAQKRMNETFFIEKEGFYSQVENNVLPHGVWQSGWVGGGMSTLSFLADGDEISVKNAVRTLEFVTGLQSSAGWYYPNYKMGACYFDDFHYDKTEEHHMVLVRKHADLTYFMFKQLVAVRQKTADMNAAADGKKECTLYALPDSIEQGAIKAADALVLLWKTYGQLGQFINAETGEIVVGNSTSGAITPAALCAAYEVTGKAEYAETAREIGEFFWQTATKTGVTCGGPGEILQAPDSESAAALLESYMALYELDGFQKWLKYARDAAHQLASWVVSYDYAFPAESRFGRMGICAAGSVWANVQNKHSAPGLCTLSAAAFLKLYRATKDVRYLELMQQISHFMPQVVSHPQRPMYPLAGTPLGDKPLGYSEMCERVNLSDWEGNAGVGDSIFGPSNWPQAAMMLTWTEIPGVYALPSENIVCVSDHVNAWLEDGCLFIENPTQMDARVKVMIEDEAQAQENLGLYWQDRFKIAAVKAGACVRVEL